MLVETRLPKLPFLAAAIFVSRALLESVNEFHNVRLLVQTQRQHMEMIRHAAVRMQRKPAVRRDIVEFCERPPPDGNVRENGPPLRTADSHEIRAASEIVPAWKSRIFVEQRHAGNLTFSNNKEKTEP